MITPHGRRRGPIRHTDPFVRSVLEAINRSGLDDGWITRRAGIGRNELSNWRGGRGAPSATRLCWVLEAIGCEVVIRDIVGPVVGAPRRG